MPIPGTDKASYPQEQAEKSQRERYFLEGPHSRKSEFWMVLRILREFISGFRVLHFAGPCVTVFGSARFKEDHPYYQLAREVGSASVAIRKRRPWATCSARPALSVISPSRSRM